jgi:hypothetical protein
MRLPFGLDLKTIVVTVLFMMFVLPFLMGLLSRGRGNGNKTA